jgi:LAS superfamily LD-carboxypeptidase LdcB
MFWIFVLMLLNPRAMAEEINLQQLSPEHEARVQSILQKLDPLIEAKRQSGDMSRLSFQELYSLLDQTEQEFLRFFQTFDPIRAGIKTQWQGLSEGVPDLVRLDNQKILRQGKEEIIAPQYVPAPAHAAYERMMQAMERDLGKRLYVDSAYRSSAYQLYLFLFYLGNHEYSILETARWNAFPGYSEHGNPQNQALDFINAEGVTGEENPEDFEKLPEYQWLTQHAHEHGFVLSFPKNAGVGIAFEPWHWRFENRHGK